MSNIKSVYYHDGIKDAQLKDLIGKDIYDANDMLLGLFKEKLHDLPIQRVIPVIGSGVSVPAGLPTWDKLLHEMWIERQKPILSRKAVGYAKTDVSLAGMYRGLTKMLDEKGFIPPHPTDLLEYAEWLRSDIENAYYNERRPHDTTDDRERFIQDKIKEDTKKTLRSIYSKKKWKEDDVKGISYESQIWSDVEQAFVIISPLGDIINKYHLNAITYNFDDLLEAYMSARGWDFLCIKETGDMYNLWDTKSLKIYHVHGCTQITDISGVSDSSSIILTESDYHDAERYSYSWLNAVQAERIHRKDMMIVGFSAQDFNFRRILRNIHQVSYEKIKKIQTLTKNDPFHIIFLPVEDALDDMQLPSGISDANICRLCIQESVQIYIKYKSRYLRRYGIYPIWTSHEVLPEMLRGLLE